MTRPEKISKRKAFNKAIRAHAAQEQTSFASVLTRTIEAQGTRPYRAMLNLPTHPPRSERRNVLGGQLRDIKVSDALDFNDRECAGCNYVQPNETLKKTVVVDLMAIAKPAKVKGVAKEFEVVKKVKDVIVLDDFEDVGFGGGEEWEAIDYDDESMEKRTYSAALSGR